MSVGSADPDGLLPMRQPGLDGFDVDAAAQNLAAVGQPTVPMDPAPAAVQVMAPGYAPPGQPPMQDTGSAQPDPQALQQGASEVSGIHAPAAAGSTPAPATAPDAGTDAAKAPAAGALPILPPPPEPPALTGDPSKDVQANVAYQRQLTGYHALLVQHQTELAQHAAGIQAKQAEREAAAEKEAAAIRQKEEQRYQAERAQRQQSIDAAVQERMLAAKDLEGASWSDKHRGATLVASLLGAIGQSLQNAGAAQIGQVGHAQNEGLNTVNKLVEQDYEKKKARLASAGNALLEARYGYKDATDNHRAALNDLDADRAAKYRLIAKEAEAQLRQQGADEATVKGNEVVLDAQQRAAAAETGIHQREEEMANQRGHNAATEAIANQDVGLKKEQIEATKDSRRDTLRERRWEHEMALADRADARAAKKDDKKAGAEAKKAEDEDKRTLRDPETGEPLTVLGSPRAVAQASDKLVAGRAYSTALRELADDIEKNGRVGSDLPIVGTDAARERARLHSEAVARGRKALELGVSGANLQLEHGAVGGSGIGLDPHQMADPKGLRAMADEQDRISTERLRSSGRAAGGKTQADVSAAAGTKKADTPKGFDAGGGVRYEMGTDGKYHKVK